MQRPAKPANEAERLQALRRYQVLDTPREADFDDLVAIATAICGVPMGSVTLIDAERQWFKAKLGMDDAPETDRDSAFCAHAILTPDAVTVVEDATLDRRFHDNPVVTAEGGIRFYAGAPLLTPEGYPLGTLCVMDSRPRELAPQQVKALQALSRQVTALLELRRTARELKLQLDDRAWFEQTLHAFNESLKLENADLTRQLRMDPLTGLANRRALADALEQALAGTAALCVALADIDHFKAINDTHGHAVGDEVLARVASSLRVANGEAGLLARYGGEEFALVLPGMDLDAARRHCEAVRQAVAEASPNLPVTISIGVAARQPGEDKAALLLRADDALYAAKRAGRNRVAHA